MKNLLFQTISAAALLILVVFGCTDKEYDENGTCKPCHARCVGCTGSQYFLGQGGCKMCTVAQKHIFGFPECLAANETTQCDKVNFHYFEEASKNDKDVVYGYCKECHGLCAQNKGCVGPKVHQCKGCELAGMKHGNLHHCLRKCPPSHPVIGTDKVCRKK